MDKDWAKMEEEFRDIHRNVLAKHEAELVQQSYGMSDYWWNIIHDDIENVEKAKESVKRMEKTLDDHCRAFGGLEKVEEIFANVEEVEKNFTISEKDLDYYLEHKEEEDEKYKRQLKKLTVKNDEIMMKCPECGELSPISVTKCPNCGVQFEEET